MTIRFKQHVVLAILTVFMILPSNPSGQKSTENLLDRQVQHFEVKAQSIQFALAGLSNEYEVPIGIELLAENSGIPDIPIEIEIRNATVQDVLNEIIKQDPNYTWRLENEVINVFPRVNRDDVLANILDTRVRTCFIKQEIARNSLRDFLTDLPEIKQKIYQAKMRASNPSYTSGDFALIGLSHPLNMSNATFREILNAVIRNSKTRFWHVLRMEENGKIFAINF